MGDSSESAWDVAWRFTSKWEGGYANHPSDPGGSTNFGITQATFNAWRDSIGSPREDVRNITRDEAKQIAKVRYWDAMGLDDVAEVSPAVAVALFDWGFHSGTQNVLNRTSGMTSAEAINTARMDFLASLTNFNSFGRGWVRRVEDLRATLASTYPVHREDVEMIQVFDGGHLIATFHPVAVSLGTSESGRTKIMVRFR